MTRRRGVVVWYSVLATGGVHRPWCTSATRASDFSEWLKWGPWIKDAEASGHWHQSQKLRKCVELRDRVVPAAPDSMDGNHKSSAKRHGQGRRLGPGWQAPSDGAEDSRGHWASSPLAHWPSSPIWHHDRLPIARASRASRA